MTLFLKTFFLFCLAFSSLSATDLNTSISDKPGYDVVVWGATITTFRESFRDLKPQERTKFAEEKIRDIPLDLDHYDVKARFGTEDNVTGAWITVNSRNVFGVIEGDNGDQPFQQYTDSIVSNLSAWLEKRHQQYSLPLIFEGIGYSTVATLLFVLLFIGLLRFSHKISTQIASEDFGKNLNLTIGGVSLLPYLTTFSVGLLKLIVWGLGLPLIYTWVTFVFRQFPYTASWGQQLTDYLFSLLSGFAQGIMEATPGIIAVIVIFIITRLIIRIIDTFFLNVEDGSLDVSWMEPETARASRRVVVVIVWIFALVVAYPYIPGSQTEAFKGITVFLGLMLSLGSAGIIGQILGGIVVVYTRAFQTGDFVKINEYEGNIDEIGVLSTKIRTLRNEEITIPNAVLLSATTTNYSRYAKKGEGAIVATTITIGYDAPWRQVHAMLDIAAGRTSTILKTPPPLVLQKALSDFYVEYTLRFAIQKPEMRYRVLSELHGHIQDVFNEHGVQIMSPNFEAQPQEKVWVPKEEWHTAPALYKED